MRGLTLWQPWASLIAFGLKTVETRSWATSYRGPVLIHAAKRRPKFEDMRVVADNLDAWNTWGAAGLVDLDSVVYPGPLGAVVAVADLVECLPIVRSMSDDDIEWNLERRVGRRFVDPGPIQVMPSGIELFGLRIIESWMEDTSYASGVRAFTDSGRSLDIQRPYGDFTHGRYAWMFDNIRPLDGPVPATGRQRLWRPGLVTVAAVNEQLGITVTGEAA